MISVDMKTSVQSHHTAVKHVNCTSDKGQIL